MRCARPSLGSRFTNSLRSRIANDRILGQSGVGRGASNIASTSITERSISVPTMRLLAKSFEPSGRPLRIARRQRSITFSKSSRLWADNFCSIAASRSGCPSLLVEFSFSVLSALVSAATQTGAISEARPATQQENIVVNQIRQAFCLLTKVDRQINRQLGVCMQVFLGNKVFVTKLVVSRS